MADYNLTNKNMDYGKYNFEGIPTHEEYQNYINRWDFLQRSYSGGAQYRMGNYLTRYVMENSHEYISRIAQTPLDNHCKSIIHIYNSFLFRNDPKRDFGNLEAMPELDNFLLDADLEGRDFMCFMRDVNIQSSIYGHCVVVVDKPKVNVGTRAEELAQGIRPYVSIFTPENILDWQFERQPSGLYELSYLKLFEREQRAFQKSTKFYLRTFTKDKIFLEEYNPDKEEATTIIEEVDNEIGKIPAVWVYAQRSSTRGIGVSDIGDIADMQNGIYNELSEIEQTIRLSGHPSLVKTIDTEASAGAGAIINVPNELDPGLKPSLLQPSGQSIDMILNSIENKVKAIDRMGHLGSVRAIEQRSMSGIALQTEMLQLDTKLIEKSKNLQLAEEHIFRLFANWMNMNWDGQIKYPSIFNIRDRNYEMDILKKAADSKPADPVIKQKIDEKIIDVIETDEDLRQAFIDKMNEPAPATTMTHTPMNTPEDMIKHMREMVEQGFTNEQIMELHPEIKNFFNGGNNGETETSPQGQENGPSQELS